MSLRKSGEKEKSEHERDEIHKVLMKSRGFAGSLTMSMAEPVALACFGG